MSGRLQGLDLETWMHAATLMWSMTGGNSRKKTPCRYQQAGNCRQVVAGRKQQADDSKQETADS